MDPHIIVCSHNSDDIKNVGARAEIETVDYLLDNLNIARVGNYRILFNYNLPYQNRGGRGTLELDLVVINQLGVFAIEVKDLHGHIDAQDGQWIQNQKYVLKDHFALIENKARILYGKLTQHSSVIGNVDMISVTPIIVLFQGTRNFTNHSSNNITITTGLDHNLIEALSSKRLLRKGLASRILAEDEIKYIADLFYGGRGKPKEALIGNYRKVGELSPGEMFEAIEGLHDQIPNRRARIKIYKMPFLSEHSEDDVKKIKRDAFAISKLGSHPNILQIYEFFQDPAQSNVFYEITEPILGLQLDEFMDQYDSVIPLDIQLACILQLCEALKHAHAQDIFHRNINPETIFIINGDTLKLGDFDFAKMVNEATRFAPGETMPRSPFVAPEVLKNPHSANAVSDIYSLGVVWFYLASLPNKEPALNHQNIDKLRVDEEVRKVIRSMTEYVPANRPQSIQRVLENIERLRQKIGVK